MRGPQEGLGWARVAVERDREGAVGVPCQRRMAATPPPSYSSAAQILHGSTSSLFQTLKDKKEGCCYSAISTRDERG
jgi:hypothetical protein